VIALDLLRPGRFLLLLPLPACQLLPLLAVLVVVPSGVADRASKIALPKAIL